MAAEKVCPFCRETIKISATVCKHCRRDLPETSIEERLTTLELSSGPQEDNGQAIDLKMKTNENKFLRWGIRVAIAVISFLAGLLLDLMP